MTTGAYTVTTETVEQYINETVRPALDSFTKIVGWLEEKDPRNFPAEMLTGTHPELPGAPEKFWDACDAFVRNLLALYDTILAKQREVVATLDLLVSGGQQAVASYRSQEDKAVGVPNGLLREVGER